MLDTSHTMGMWLRTMSSKTYITETLGRQRNYLRTELRQLLSSNGNTVGKALCRLSKARLASSQSVSMTLPSPVEPSDG